MSVDPLWNHDRIVELLCESGRIAFECRKQLKKSFKADESIVTQADCTIEALFTETLEDEASGVYLIGEETLSEKGEEYLAAALAGDCYVIDPIDGTAPYAHGLPHWGVSVGLMRGGRLTDGAIFLPDLNRPEITISDGVGVREGLQCGGDWEWRTLEARSDGADADAPLAISQDIARTGRVGIETPLHAIGSAVFALIGVLKRRYRAYVGLLRLWDVAGCLPLLERMGISLYHLEDSALRDLGTEVTEDHFELSATAERRWEVLGWLLACHSGDEDILRRGVDPRSGAV